MQHSLVSEHVIGDMALPTEASHPKMVLWTVGATSRDGTPDGGILPRDVTPDGETTSRDGTPDRLWHSNQDAANAHFTAKLSCNAV